MEFQLTTKKLITFKLGDKLNIKIKVKFMLDFDILYSYSFHIIIFKSVKSNNSDIFLSQF